jgi:hypothetical protein
MLEAFNFLNLNASKTAADPKVSLDAVKSLSPDDIALCRTFEQRTPYRKAIGMLLHAARSTRQDIAFITGQLTVVRSRGILVRAANTRFSSNESSFFCMELIHLTRSASGRREMLLQLCSSAVRVTSSM